MTLNTVTCNTSHQTEVHERMVGQGLSHEGDVRNCLRVRFWQETEKIQQQEQRQHDWGELQTEQAG